MDNRVCPKCGKSYDRPPAVSREDNSTYICPECGQREALEQYLKMLEKYGGNNGGNNEK